jgi:hypothetical protein
MQHTALPGYLAFCVKNGSLSKRKRVCLNHRPQRRALEINLLNARKVCLWRQKRK